MLVQEYDAALYPRSRRDHKRYAPRQFAHRPRWVLHRPEGETWKGFAAVRALPEVPPEVLLVPLFGHSRGHCGVAVEEDGRWLLLAGDAFFHHDELDPRRRRCPPGLRIYQNVFQYNRRARLRNQERLRELAHRERGLVRVICSHDPDMLATMARSRRPAEAPATARRERAPELSGVHA